MLEYTGQNFSPWKVQMQITFKNKNPMAADGTATMEAAAVPDVWKKKKINAAKWLITAAVDTEHLAMIVDCNTAADMWARLLTIYT